MVAQISLIMPVHNRERYLSDAIESVLGQTKPDFELLVWDDGSTDRSLEIARAYAQRDKRVRVISAHNQGVTRAFKAAIAQTTNPYIGCIDSDDLLAPTALEETATVLDTNPQIGLVYTKYLVIDENGQLKGEGTRSRIPYSKERILVDFMIFHFRLFRRSVYEQIGGIDESFTCAYDYDLCLRLCEVTEVQQVNKPLYYYRNHSQSVSHQRRIDQILYSREAIVRALQRRGLSQHYELDVEIVGKFSLRRKHPGQKF